VVDVTRSAVEELCIEVDAFDSLNSV